MTDLDFPGAALLDEAGVLLRRLRDARLTVCTAESCTGGLVAAALTHHAGSSEALLCGFVTYSDVAKQAMLGVDPRLLAAHGAVSEAVVAAMAAGAVRRGGSDLAVSVSGIAGPGGATPNKPVGTVWFGVHAASGFRDTRHVVLPGNRAAVRDAAARVALELLGKAIDAAT
ncbi:MAG: CinA family protein [Gluconacetobacter diazotrophicus]|nr:CinA family protein [Gluconacetobacter diazotrophicus]